MHKYSNSKYNLKRLKSRQGGSKKLCADRACIERKGGANQLATKTRGLIKGI